MFDLRTFIIYGYKLNLIDPLILQKKSVYFYHI